MTLLALDTFRSLPVWLIVDFAAVAIFAITGALVASRKQLDVMGFVWLGTVTGIGGGSVRDVLLDRPVFWIVEPGYLVVCAVVSVATFLTAHLVLSRYRLLLWLDAVGLAMFAVVGAEKALASGAGPVVAIAMGMITATLGGIIRDVLGNEPSVLLSREVYVTAAFVSATVFVVANAAALPAGASALAGFGAGFLLRAAALRYALALPVYKPRPARTVSEAKRLTRRDQGRMDGDEGTA